MRLPGGDRAVLELSKLSGYCLAPTHPRGRHKARVFEARLGITAPEAAQLRAQLLRGAAIAENAVPGAKDGFGRRFALDLAINGLKDTAMVRTGWIVRSGEDFPRFTSCYVL